MADYALLIALVFAVNLLPAFGPPTWAVLVFLKLNLGLAAVPLVLLGAIAAASGRLVLAYGARHFRGRLSRKRIENLEAAEEALAGSRGKALTGLGLFALSPVPSAQLFVGAGLLAVPIVPLTLAFFAGRLVSYSLYVGAAALAADNLKTIVTESLTSPAGLAAQAVMLVLLVLLVRVDWAKLIAKRRSLPRPASARGA